MSTDCQLEGYEVDFKLKNNDRGCNLECTCDVHMEDLRSTSVVATSPKLLEEVNGVGL